MNKFLTKIKKKFYNFDKVVKKNVNEEDLFHKEIIFENNLKYNQLIKLKAFYLGSFQFNMEKLIEFTEIRNELKRVKASPQKGLLQINMHSSSFSTENELKFDHMLSVIAKIGFLESTNLMYYIVSDKTSLTTTLYAFAAKDTCGKSLAAALSKSFERKRIDTKNKIAKMSTGILLDL